MSDAWLLDDAWLMDSAWLLKDGAYLLTLGRVLLKSSTSRRIIRTITVITLPP